MKKRIYLGYWVLQLLACSKPFKNVPIQNTPVQPEINYYEPHLTPITDSQQTHLIRACALSGQYYREGRGYMNPCFNPNNPYEIAFMQADSNKCVGLFKFSFVTGKKTYLIPLPCGSIDWSSKGWILFVTYEGNLSKIKDNGDSLTTLAQTGRLEPKWSPSGDAFMYTIGDEISICNANGTLIKTIHDRIATLDWLSDSTLIYSDYQNHIKYNILTDRRENVPTYKFAMNLWEKGEHFAYYWVSKGIGKTDYYMRYNYNTEITDTLKILYDSYFYINLKYHPKTKKCLVELDRRKWKDAHKCDLLYKRNLILMNPDGTDEKLIKIPE